MKKNRKNNIKSITVMLFIITALIWGIMLIIKWFWWGMDFKTLFDDIVSNMLGILPPIILFNFVYEYLTKEHMAEEMGEHITDTLMSNPEAISVLSTENRLKFIKTTMETIVGDESKDMVYSVIEPYLTKQYNIKQTFKYTITLRDYHGSDMFDSQKYMKVYEDLKYTKVYLDDGLDNELYVGFFCKANDLDKALRNHNYIFREHLDIYEEEIKKLVNLSEEGQLSFIKDELKIRVFVDGVECSLSEFTLDESGVAVKFNSIHSKGLKKHSVEISFAIPHTRERSDFLVSISEPTYSPLIQLLYPEGKMKVKAFSFMNDGEDSLIENANHYPGGYEFSIQDKWIYPIGGVLFTIEDIK